jgi:hypothetical protein
MGTIHADKEGGVTMTEAIQLYIGDKLYAYINRQRRELDLCYKDMCSIQITFEQFHKLARHIRDAEELKYREENKHEVEI